MSDNTIDMLDTIQREVKDGAGTWGDRQDMLRWAVNEIRILRGYTALADAQIAERDATIAEIRSSMGYGTVLMLKGELEALRKELAARKEDAK